MFEDQSRVDISPHHPHAVDWLSHQVPTCCLQALSSVGLLEGHQDAHSTSVLAAPSSRQPQWCKDGTTECYGPPEII